MHLFSLKLVSLRERVVKHITAKDICQIESVNITSFVESLTSSAESPVLLKENSLRDCISPDSASVGHCNEKNALNAYKQRREQFSPHCFYRNKSTSCQIPRNDQNGFVLTLKSISVAPVPRIAFSRSTSGTPEHSGSPGLLANKIN